MIQGEACVYIDPDHEDHILSSAKKPKNDADESTTAENQSTEMKAEAPLVQSDTEPAAQGTLAERRKAFEQQPSSQSRKKNPSYDSSSENDEAITTTSSSTGTPTQAIRVLDSATPTPSKPSSLNPNSISPAPTKSTAAILTTSYTTPLARAPSPLSCVTKPTEKLAPEPETEIPGKTEEGSQSPSDLKRMPSPPPTITTEQLWRTSADFAVAVKSVSLLIASFIAKVVRAVAHTVATNPQLQMLGVYLIDRFNDLIRAVKDYFIYLWTPESDPIEETETISSSESVGEAEEGGETEPEPVAKFNWRLLIFVVVSAALLSAAVIAPKRKEHAPPLNGEPNTRHSKHEKIGSARVNEIYMNRYRQAEGAIKGLCEDCIVLRPFGGIDSDDEEEYSVDEDSESDSNAAYEGSSYVEIGDLDDCTAYTSNEAIHEAFQSFKRGREILGSSMEKLRSTRSVGRRLSSTIRLIRERLAPKLASIFSSVLVVSSRHSRSLLLRSKASLFEASKLARVILLSAVSNALIAVVSVHEFAKGSVGSLLSAVTFTALSLANMLAAVGQKGVSRINSANAATSKLFSGVQRYVTTGLGRDFTWAALRSSHALLHVITVLLVLYGGQHFFSFFLTLI